MKTEPDYVKICHRCEQPVKLTREEFQADPQTWTTCEACCATLRAEAAVIGARVGETIPRRLTD